MTGWKPVPQRRDDRLEAGPTQEDDRREVVPQRRDDRLEAGPTEKK
jgi:hypothetical protein